MTHACFFRVDLSLHHPSGGLALFKNILSRPQSKLMSRMLFFSFALVRTDRLLTQRVSNLKPWTCGVCAIAHMRSRACAHCCKGRREGCAAMMIIIWSWRIASPLTVQKPIGVTALQISSILEDNVRVQNLWLIQLFSRGDQSPRCLSLARRDRFSFNRAEMTFN